jgi:hypothetical protein
MARLSLCTVDWRFHQGCDRYGRYAATGGSGCDHAKKSEFWTCSKLASWEPLSADTPDSYHPTHHYPLPDDWCHLRAMHSQNSRAFLVTCCLLLPTGSIQLCLPSHIPMLCVGFTSAAPLPPIEWGRDCPVMIGYEQLALNTFSCQLYNCPAPTWAATIVLHTNMV